MRIRLLSLLLLSCFLLPHLTSEEPKPLIKATQKEISKEPKQHKKFILGLHFGYSSYHGLAGVELQWKRFSFSFGYTNRPNLGLKFYFRKGLQGSFYLGPLASFFDHYALIGFGGGYRWIWKSGFTMSAGIAHGTFIDFDKYDDERSDAATPIALPNFTIGWAF